MSQALSIKSHSHVSIVGIYLANAIHYPPLFLESRLRLDLKLLCSRISLVSLVFSFLVSLVLSLLVLSLVLSVLRCLIPTFLSRSYPSSESVYRLVFLLRLYVLWNFGLFWISVLNVQSEGKVCFKEGKGRSQLLYQLSLGHETVILFWTLSIPIQQKKKLSRVTYGYLFIVLSQRSVSITRFKVRIRLALLSFSNVSLLVLCQSFYLRNYMNLVSRPYGLLVLWLSSQCRCPVDFPSSPLRRYPTPQVNAPYATASYCPPCTNPKPARPRNALPFVLLFTGLFLLLSLKVLGRMEGFKEERSVSTPRASNQFCLTCCITFLLQTISIKASEIPL